MTFVCSCYISHRLATVTVSVVDTVLNPGAKPTFVGTLNLMVDEWAMLQKLLLAGAEHTNVKVEVVNEKV